MSGEKVAQSEASPQEEKEGGMLPALLLAAAILGVVALLFVWPSEDDAGRNANANRSGAQGAGADAQGGGALGKGPGGVQDRDADKASRPAPEPRRNPQIKLPTEMGIAPPPPKEEVPDFSTRDEEIAWYERKLEQAERMRDSRQKFADRLPRIRDRIASGDNPDEGLKAFEGREKIVNDNLAKAQAKVEMLQKKLDALRGT